jgi:hypothetical protein
VIRPLLPGQAQRLIFGHPDRDRAQQFALMHDGDAHVAAGHRRHRLANDRQRARVRAAVRPSLGAELVIHPQPHDDLLGLRSRPTGKDPGAATRARSP